MGKVKSHFIITVNTAHALTGQQMGAESGDKMSQETRREEEAGIICLEGFPMDTS